jgi:hypothetical protein
MKNLQQQVVSQVFFKREARLVTTKSTMRLVDVFTSAFPSDYHAEAQVMIQLMSHDGMYYQMHWD